ncbi:legumain-like [Clarias gariepinus]|uniref:legumain-like n=1 Tax=Clarias gariepinus TaxID=13013 RepID=UPI00234DF761|nr:legumain-like [Clarias gariepinus]
MGVDSKSNSSKTWVLLAAGSKDWKDYNDQANVCHAYQVFHKNGIPDEQIVVMMYDDIAYNEENPFKGKIINVPNGTNVYTGVPKDYTGEEVSAENFLAVLRGDSAAVKKTGPKKVIQSGENDSIFIYLTSHGLVGSFSFPNSNLSARNLTDTIHAMSRNRKFSKMVIYMQACHSGSMFEELRDMNNVYAVASCRPDECSYAYCRDKQRNVFLTDYFTFHWLQHTKTVNLDRTSFRDQFSYLMKNVKECMGKEKTQTPCNYGNMCDSPLSQILGNDVKDDAPASGCSIC